MRNVKQLHPVLQAKIERLLELCREDGIYIGIGECYRTVAEQDALYAKGRTAPGGIVTNAKGSTYSSMHQWGVAFDFYLKMDIDGDGKTSDDAFNNAKKTFNKVGKLAKSIGLEWGGDWKSIVDMPHLQLPNWGSTPSKLKALYGTADRFIKSWGGDTINQQGASSGQIAKNKVECPKTKDVTYADTYIVKSTCNLMSGAGTKKNVVNVIPAAAKVKCYGYYTKNKKGNIWLYVAYGKYEGFVNLKKVRRT